MATDIPTSSTVSSSKKSSTQAGATGKVRTFKPTGKGLVFERMYTKAGVHPFDEVTWELRDASITNERGEAVFEQNGVEFPEFWSQMSTNVVVSKYFRGKIGTPEREHSVKQLIGRVVDTITAWGKKDGVFASDESAEALRAELAYLILHQKMAFNSPVWFNVGVEDRPQASACFINSVQDTMGDIMDLAKTECMLFKWGSGAGSNLSTIRSSREHLSGGGQASGPVSFMRGYDSFAGAIKSGGKTRRAAKMVILNAEHPDIVDFVESKAGEERKAWALIEHGYDGGFNVPGGAYDSVFFQNANHSVRASDAFMQAVVDDAEWTTKAVVDGSPVETMKATDVMHKIADAAWVCGDPGMQYDTTINDWHTCKNTDRIHASNPCSEYIFLDDTACNLASLNLLTYRKEDGSFDVESFKHASRLTITAQEIIVPNASYPTPQIEKNSHDFRPLGLGFTNLGALLMVRGIPYDSAQGRAIAGSITALMCGEAYAQSAQIAKALGPFSGYPVNEEPMLGVIKMHRDSVKKIADEHGEIAKDPIFQAAQDSWDEAYAQGKEYGFRNAQVTVLAPTGTISFLMDCDTTGIEPDIALIKYKKLVGGGYFKIVNRSVPEALTALGYSSAERKAIEDYLMEHDTIEGAPFLKDEHLTVFDCAFVAANGTRSIEPMGHVRMMAACQPFLSGAISKTVNMPNDATVEEIAQVYVDAWKLGLKAIAIYRDGCKRTQPLSTSLDTGEVKEATEAPAVMAVAEQTIQQAPMKRRRRLPDERPSITHKFSIAGHEGYITVGMYEDGQPGEIFIVMSKEGSVVSGLMDSFATSISLCLQYGVPLEVLVDKFSFTRFEPSGFTNNPRIRIAHSITDYLFRWLADKFMGDAQKSRYFSNLEASAEVESPVVTPQAVVEAVAGNQEQEQAAPSTNAARSKFEAAPAGSVVYEAENNSPFSLQADAPPCHVCGGITVRAGACYSCPNCGATTGCG